MIPTTRINEKGITASVAHLSSTSVNLLRLTIAARTGTLIWREALFTIFQTRSSTMFIPVSLGKLKTKKWTINSKQTLSMRLEVMCQRSRRLLSRTSTICLGWTWTRTRPRILPNLVYVVPGSFKIPIFYLFEDWNMLGTMHREEWERISSIKTSTRTWQTSWRFTKSGAIIYSQRPSLVTS